MGLAGLLGVERGISAVIGSGGKTTLLRALGQAVPHKLPKSEVLALL